MTARSRPHPMLLPDPAPGPTPARGPETPGEFFGPPPPVPEVRSGAAGAKESTVPCPFRIIADTREQHPYTFSHVPSNAETQHKPFAVDVVRLGLPIGDYTVEGTGAGILIERKSKADLFGSIIKRENFEHRLERLDTEPLSAHIVVEAEWSEIMTDPPKHTEFSPTSLHRTVQSWTQRYSRVHWWFYPGREAAESGTFWLLYRFWANSRDNRLARDREQANHAAYLAGIAARRMAIPIDKCPYPKKPEGGQLGTPGDEWARGWLDFDGIEKSRNMSNPKEGGVA